MWRLFETDASWRSLIQRVVLAGVMLPHGLQKLGAFGGGGGLEQSSQYLAHATHLPYVFGVLAVLAETVGALLLLTGFLTRLGAIGVTGVMIGAVLSTHLGNGFFMNWFGDKGGEGFEYHLLALALAIPLIVSGGGLWSIDRAIDRHWHHRDTPLEPAHAAV
jgi:putative oxidoreductase